MIGLASITRGRKAIAACFSIAVALLCLLAPTCSYAEETICYLGNAVETGTDNGYSEDRLIGEDSPHFGWDLGSFYVSGFTSKQKAEDGSFIFLKTSGDKLALHFRLDQDIDALNGSDRLSIADDVNGFDEAMGVSRSENGFGRGTVIIRRTDYQNAKSDPIIYRDYLEGVKQGADVEVQLFEEGDYEVKFNYEIKNDVRKPFGAVSILPEYSNYCISFNYKVRNGNTMVFPLDSKTGGELVNESSTPHGFTIDMAKSRYLDVSVKREVLAGDGNSLVSTDTRENGPARDGEKYEEPGIYTITASNPVTGEKTSKVIYVGEDPVLRAYVVNDSSLKEIREKISQGAKVGKDGKLEWPEGALSTTEETGEEDGLPFLPFVVVAVLVAAGIAWAAVKRKKVLPSSAEKALPEREADYEAVQDVEK